MPRGKTILYVEDELPENHPNYDTLWTFLEEKNYTITAARTGQEARQILSNINFDLVLFDIMLPVGDGGNEGDTRLEMGLILLRELREGAFVAAGQTGTDKETPVVVISAIMGVERWEEIEQLTDQWNGCAFAKPISRKIVISKINELLATE